MSQLDSTRPERFPPGSLVRVRGRDWVVVAHEEDGEILRLRPLDGTDREGCGVLPGLGHDRITQAQFPDPPADRVGDAAGLRLLFDAARLLLRSGAAPIRALGHLSVVPRPYQYVPLLMALGLDPVRLLVADDVGTGKTVEAALIARELVDRGIVRRIGVLAPAHLCDQWQRELAEKFALEAELVAPATLAALERRLPRPDLGVWAWLDAAVASIDFVKGQRHRAHFLRCAPDLVIVDEAHLCARPRGADRRHPQQQRYELLRDLVNRHPGVHLLLVTATPHSGIEESFRSLLGLLDPAFEEHADRRRLRRHIVQRRRQEVAHWMGETTPFPTRVAREVTYRLTPDYHALFAKVLDFCRESVGTGDRRDARQRVRYWGAIAILRCVLSSPEAAQAVLERKAGADEAPGSRASPTDESPEEVDARQRPFVTDVVDEAGGTDVAPAAAVQEAQSLFEVRERRRLRAFARQAAELAGPRRDAKLERLLEEIDGLLRDDYHPIVFCRYIPTAHYVGRHLREAFGDVAVEVITGELPDERRRELVEALGGKPRRILVATDCLSEGINLQEHFDAVIHYDLPWNPNRLEQREGRVDRFGQRRGEVRAITIYGADNRVDLAVLDVLIRKARRIRESLGIVVPVPAGAEEILEAVVGEVLLSRRGLQLELALEDDRVQGLLRRWDRAVEGERELRSYYAQEEISPDQVRRELEETDDVLGDPQAVARFLREFAHRMQGGFEADGRAVRFHPGEAERDVVEALGVPPPYRLVFDRTADPTAICVGRSHPLVETAARHVLGRALAPDPPPFLARLGVMRTDAVDRVTALALLRLRYTLEEREPALFAEEVRVVAIRREEGRPVLPEPVERLGRDLAERAEPRPPDPSPEERRHWIGRTRELLDAHPAWWRPLVDHRCRAIEEAHRRLRRITREGAFRVRPRTPPDLLALVVLLPTGDRA